MIAPCRSRQKTDLREPGRFLGLFETPDVVHDAEPGENGWLWLQNGCFS